MTDHQPGRRDELLPERTGDEREEVWERDRESDDERLLREVPPHHGD